MNKCINTVTQSAQRNGAVAKTDHIIGIYKHDIRFDYLFNAKRDLCNTLFSDDA